VQRAAKLVEPLLRPKGKIQPALGLFDQANYETSHAALSPGDLLMLFTDGLFEVNGANEEIYTQAQLREAVRSRLTLPAPQLFDDVIGEIRATSSTGEFDDDVCVIGMEFTDRAPIKIP
jgi:sigma-B regulation protein RsbU (phosphoserine phosphatase)